MNGIEPGAGSEIEAVQLKGSPLTSAPPKHDPLMPQVERPAAWERAPSKAGCSVVPPAKSSMSFCLF